MVMLCPVSRLTKRIALITICVLFVTHGLAFSDDAGQPFTIAILPDTQHYCNSHPEKGPAAGWDKYFYSQIAYCTDPAPTMPRMVIHLGDIVQHGAIESEWEIAEKAFAPLDKAGIPYCVVAGNNDYDDVENCLKPKGFRTHFGPTRFKGKPWLGGIREPDGLSSYHFFKGNSRQYMVLCLEMDADDDALAWAQAALDAHPGVPTIVVTHEYLSDLIKGRSPFPSVNRTGRNPKANPPILLWHKLVRRNSQIFMVLCGHWARSGGECHQVSQNDAGKPVYELLSDYQCRPDGGGGWMRELRFFPAEGRIEVFTLNPSIKPGGVVYERGRDSFFSLPFRYEDYGLSQEEVAAHPARTATEPSTPQIAENPQ